MRDNNFNQAPRVHIPSDQSHQRRSAATTTASNRLVCLTWLAGYLLTIDTTYLYRLVLSFFIPTNPSRSSNNISHWTDRQTWVACASSERASPGADDELFSLSLSLPPSVPLNCFAMQLWYSISSSPNHGAPNCLSVAPQKNCKHYRD